MSDQTELSAGGCRTSRHWTYPAPLVARSCLGGTPNFRAYSRLNWLGLSYPTSKAAVVTEAPFILRSFRASSRRSSLWNCSGVVEPDFETGHPL